MVYDLYKAAEEFPIQIKEDINSIQRVIDSIDSDIAVLRKKDIANPKILELKNYRKQLESNQIRYNKVYSESLANLDLFAFSRRIGQQRRLIDAIYTISVTAGYTTIESFKNIVSAIVPGVCRVQLGHIWHYFAHYDEATLNAVIKTAKVLEETKTKNKP